ncbi:hypothetical protein GCM10009648_44020 [Tsukamurella spumae]
MKMTRRPPVPDTPPCAHEWKRYRETITPSRDAKAIKHGYDYRQGRSYFIVLACGQCKSKRRIEMVVESW